MNNKYRKYFYYIIFLITGFYIGKTELVPYLHQQTAWSIGIYEGVSPFTIKPAKNIKNPVLSAKDVKDVNALFVADPFMIFNDNKWYMFFEVLNKDTDKGEIGLAVSDDGYHWKYQKIVLKEKYNLSYPYVFKYNNEFYMIPEIQGSYSIKIYKAINFPSEWIFVKNIIKGNYADSSIFYFKNKWWIYTSDRYDVLHLYYSNSLLGDWKEHPQSPIIELDSTKSRPAGRVLIYDNKIYRFTQDCSKGYGRLVRVFEVLDLSEKTYKEVEIKESPIIGPTGAGWNSNKMHTIDLHKKGDGTWIASVDGHSKYIVLDNKK